MSFVSRLCYFGSAAIAGAVATHGYDVHQASKHMPQPQRGSLIRRMYEVARAWMTAKKIQDLYTASRHAATINHISAKFREEFDYHVWDSPHLAFQQNLYTLYPVFKYSHKRPYEREDDFIFQGGVEDTTAHAKQDITAGNYVRCPSGAIVKNLEKLNDSSEEGKKAPSVLTDVFITKTTDCQVCDKFQTRLLYDAAKIASGEDMLMFDFAEQPRSLDTKTTVFVKAEEEEQDGPSFSATTLDNLTAKNKKAILDDNFVPCHFRRIDQPVAREAKFHGRGAIVIGDKNLEICDYILKNLSEIKKD